MAPANKGEKLMIQSSKTNKAMRRKTKQDWMPKALREPHMETAKELLVAADLVGADHVVAADQGILTEPIRGALVEFLRVASTNLQLSTQLEVKRRHSSLSSHR
jgi:hypothetical protein